MDPRLGTDTSGPGEAVFAIRFNGKPQNILKNQNFRTRKQIRKHPKQILLTGVSYYPFFGRPGCNRGAQKKKFSRRFPGIFQIVFRKKTEKFRKFSGREFPRLPAVGSGPNFARMKL